MKLYLPLFLLPLLMASCSQGDEDNDASRNIQKIYFAVPRYGTWEDDTNGSQADNDNLDLGTIIKETDTIPATAGTIYGIEYRVTATLRQTVMLRHEWIYPMPMYSTAYDDTVAKEEDVDYPSLDGLSHIQRRITADEASHKGRWQLRVYYGNHLMYRKNFYLR